MSFSVCCILKISGEKKEIKLLRSSIIDNKIFESLLPPPKDLLEIQETSESVNGKTIQEHGNMDEYFEKISQWKSKNWGHCSGDSWSEMISHGKNHVEYRSIYQRIFPVNGFIALSKKYPNLKFHIEDLFEEEYTINVEITWQNGEEIEFIDDAEYISQKRIKRASSFRNRVNRLMFESWRLRNKYIKPILKKLGLIKPRTEKVFPDP